MTSDPMDNAQYWEGFNCGKENEPWTKVPYEPGTRKFHKWVEGWEDGVKARFLQKK